MSNEKRPYTVSTPYIEVTEYKEVLRGSYFGATWHERHKVKTLKDNENHFTAEDIQHYMDNKDKPEVKPRR